MNDLKELLFAETFNSRDRYNLCRKVYGEYEYLTSMAHSRFSALYTLIEDAGLEDEYQSWKKKQTGKAVSE